MTMTAAPNRIRARSKTVTPPGPARDGSHKQIFGVNQQIPGRGQTYLSDISLKVIWEKQRTSTFSHHRRVKRLSSIRSAN
jgi:hypothetical protein